MSIPLNDFLAIFPTANAPVSVIESLKIKCMVAKTSKDEPEVTDVDGFVYSLDHVIVGKGELKVFEKVYPPSSSSYEVGWVIEENVKYCMLCEGEFGIFNWKHHCRSCGYVMCSACSPYNVPIPECVETGEISSKVCCNCFGFKSTRVSAQKRSSFGDAARRPSANGMDEISPVPYTNTSFSSNPNSQSKEIISSSSSKWENMVNSGEVARPAETFRLLEEDFDNRDVFVVKTKAALEAFEKAQLSKYEESYM